MTKDDLFAIAVDKTESLDLRYAVARELQRLRTPAGEIPEDIRWTFRTTLIRRNKNLMAVSN